MLPVVDEHGGLTGRHMVSYCLALIPVSLAPVLFLQAGPVYAAGAILLGVGFLRSAVSFWRRTSTAQARNVLHASLVYLPVLLALLLLEGLTGAIAFAL